MLRFAERPDNSLLIPHNMETKPTPQDALRVLDAATLPSNAGKLNRADYANINAALELLATFVSDHTTPNEEEKPKRGRPAKGAFGAPEKP